MLHGAAIRALVTMVTVSTVALPAAGSLPGSGARVTGELAAAGGVPAGLEVVVLDDLGADLASTTVRPDGRFRVDGLPADSAVYVALRDGDGRLLGYWDGGDGLTADIDRADPAWVAAGRDAIARITLGD